MVCGEIVSTNARWRSMVARVKTVATQAFQIWLSADLQELGWDIPPVTLTSFVKPVDTWADMTHLVDRERWPAAQRPGHIAYLCGPLAEPDAYPPTDDHDFPARAIEFCRHITNKQDVRRR